MRPLVLLALLTACNGETIDPSQDADGDGFSSDQGDCDDSNTGIFPGATERCDGVDSDCDGADGGDDLTGSATFYEDTDSDGYGVERTSVQACEVPAGVWSELPGDCAPDDATSNPGAEEVCDGVDNDCSGTVDNDLPAVFADTDGDGFGDPNAALAGCETNANRAANDDDCDDTDASVTPETIWYFDTDEDGFGIDEVTEVSCTSPGGDYALQGGDCRPDDANGYPGADEICDNGQQAQNIDDNCDGQVDEGCEQLFNCDTIAVDTTWSGDMVVPCDVVVQGTPMPTLTIADGTVVRFGAGRSLIIGMLDLGRLVVEGGAVGVLLTSNEEAPEAGDWGGLVIDNAPGSTLDGLTLAYAGADGEALITWAEDLIATDLTVQNIEGDGVRVGGGEAQVTGLTATGVTGAVIRCDSGADISVNDAEVSTAGSPLIAHLDCADAYAGDLSFAGLDDGFATISGLTITETATWSNLGVPYRLLDGANVAGAEDGAVWTIEPGVVVEVAAGKRISIGAAGGGELSAVGTQDEPIVFTSSAASPAAGDWTGVVMQQNRGAATLTHVEILFSGSSDVFDAGLYISGDGASVVAQNLTVSDGAADGITVWNGLLSLSDSDVRDNEGDGLVVDPFGDLVGVSSTAITGNGGAARIANSDAITRIEDTTTFIGNTDNRIRITDMTLKRDSVWVDLGLPYLIETSLTVASEVGADLTLTNAVLEFAAGAQLQIGSTDGQTGTLVASGAEFRGAGASPGAGFWNGIGVRGDASITNSTIRQAGNSPSSAVDLFSGSSVVTGNAFESISGESVTCWVGSGPNIVTGNTLNGMPYFGCD